MGEEDKVCCRFAGGSGIGERRCLDITVVGRVQLELVDVAR